MDINRKFVIIFGSDYDEYAFSSKINKNLIPLNISKFYKKTNLFLKVLFKFHLSYRINKLINLPFKSLWILRELKQIDLSENYVFVFNRSYDTIKKNFNFDINEYLKEKNEKNIFIMYFNDQFRTYKYNYNYYDLCFDYLFSYDKIDAKRNNFNYLKSGYDINRFLNLDCTKLEYDILFVGRAKNRLDKIIYISDELTKRGLNCIFFVTGIENNKDIKRSNFFVNKTIDYSLNLQLIQKSRSILEIIQEDSYSHTLRMGEALAFKKILVTNNLFLEINEKSDEKWIFKINFNSLELDIIADSIKKFSVAEYSEHIIYDYSTEKFISSLDNFLNFKEIR